MTSEADFRRSLPADGTWTLTYQGPIIAATDTSGRYPAQYLDTRTGAVSSRASGKLHA